MGGRVGFWEGGVGGEGGGGEEGGLWDLDVDVDVIIGGWWMAMVMCVGWL